MSLIRSILTPSVQSAWDSYVESANQTGHAYLGITFGLLPCAVWGWWGVAVPLGISAAWEAWHLIRQRGAEREGARRWDAVKDFACRNIMDKSALFSAAQSAAQAEGYAVTEIVRGSEYVIRIHPEGAAGGEWPELSTWLAGDGAVEINEDDAADHVAALVAAMAPVD